MDDRTRTDDLILIRWLSTPRGDVNAIRRVASDVSDWVSFARRAEQHGLGGVLHRSAAAAGVVLPAPLSLAWNERRDAERAWREQLLEVTESAARAMSAAGIDAVVLKGPILAERLYDEPALRISTDVDLMIAERDFDAAVSALRKIGFEIEPGATQVFHRKHHHHVLLERNGGIGIELHFRAFTGFGATIPSEPLLARAIRYASRTGFEFSILEPNDEWMYLAAHAAGHLLERLSWTHDLALYPDRIGPLDAHVIETRAAIFGLDRAIAWTAWWLARHRLPSPVKSALSPLQANVAEWLRNASLDSPSRAFLQIGTLAFTGLLARDAASASRMIGRSATRIAKRRARQHLPGWVPETWGG